MFTLKKLEELIVQPYYFSSETIVRLEIKKHVSGTKSGSKFLLKIEAYSLKWFEWFSCVEVNSGANRNLESGEILIPVVFWFLSVVIRWLCSICDEEQSNTGLSPPGIIIP